MYLTYRGQTYHLTSEQELLILCAALAQLDALAA